MNKHTKNMDFKNEDHVRYPRTSWLAVLRERPSPTICYLKTDCSPMSWTMPMRCQPQMRSLQSCLQLLQFVVFCPSVCRKALG